MKPLNIAMVAACPFPENRGTPSRILGMAESLARRGHTIHVVTYHFGRDIDTHGFEIHRIRKVDSKHNFAPGPTIKKLALYDPLLFIKLLSVVKDNDVDLIHAHHFEGALVGYAVRCVKKIPVVYDAHTTLSAELPSYGPWNIRRVARFLDRFVPRKADFNVAVSRRLQNSMLREGIPAERISVLPTGIDVSDFANANPDRVREGLALGSSKMIIYTGSLEEFQNIELLLGTMVHVSSAINDAILVLVGGGEIQKYSRMCREMGIQEKVRFVGEKPFSEVTDYLACADVAVTARINCPGVPQKLINYMMAGKAIVGFEGSADLLSRNTDGMVVENGNIEAMADAIVALLNDPALRKQLGENAQKRARETFDWDILATQLETTYGYLLNDG